MEAVISMGRQQSLTNTIPTRLLVLEVKVIGNGICEVHSALIKQVLPLTYSPLLGACADSVDSLQETVDTTGR